MILTLDIGTTRMKAGIFSSSGELVENSSCMSSTGEATTSSVEADPACIIKNLRNLTNSLSTLSNCTAVTITANGPTLIPVQSLPYFDREELRVDTQSARLWLDRRAVKESEQVSSITGNYVDPSFFVPKALYFKRTQPKEYEKSNHLLFLNDFIDYVLTGVAKTVFPSQGLERWYWDYDMLMQLELDPDKFPSFMSPGDLVGHITAGAAAYFSLPEGIPVFAGAPDFYVSILGTGAIQPGSVCNRSGTSEGINVCSTVPESDNRLMSYRHPVSEFYNISGIISTSGKAIGWIRELFDLDSKPFDDFYDMVADSPAGADGLIFLPYLAGERAPIWDAEALGVFNGLKLNTSKEDIVRSVCEGVCFAIRDVIEVMENLGHGVNELRVTGGPAESKVLNQLKADITGRKVLIPVVSEAELVGCLVLAMKGMGAYPSFAEAAQHLVHIKEVYEPEASQLKRYDRLFGVYRRTYTQLKHEFKNLCK